MPVVTAGDIVRDVFKKAGILGVGQQLQAEDINAGFQDLQEMMSQWQRKRYLVWHLVDTGILSTGAQSYTVGTGGDFNISRPDQFDYAYIRQITQSPNLPVDYPLEILWAYEDYASIALKNLHSWPGYMFYDSAYPMGRAFPWPIPEAHLYEIHIITKQQLQQFQNLADPVDLPPEYNAALRWNLVPRIMASYPQTTESAIHADRLSRLARDSLNVIRVSNAQVPRARMPNRLVRSGRYNVFSDNAV